MDELEKTGQTELPGAHRTKKGLWPWGGKKNAAKGASAAAVQPAADAASGNGSGNGSHGDSDSENVVGEAGAPGMTAPSGLAGSLPGGDLPAYRESTSAAPAPEASAAVPAAPAAEPYPHDAVTEALPVVGASLTQTAPSHPAETFVLPDAPASFAGPEVEAPATGSSETGTFAPPSEPGKTPTPKKRGAWPWARKKGEPKGTPAVPAAEAAAMAAAGSAAAAVSETASAGVADAAEAGMMAAAEAPAAPEAVTEPGAPIGAAVAPTAGAEGAATATGAGAEGAAPVAAEVAASAAVAGAAEPGIPGPSEFTLPEKRSFWPWRGKKPQASQGAPVQPEPVPELTSTSEWLPPEENTGLFGTGTAPAPSAAGAPSGEYAAHESEAAQAAAAAAAVGAGAAFAAQAAPVAEPPAAAPAGPSAPAPPAAAPQGAPGAAPYQWTPAAAPEPAAAGSGASLGAPLAGPAGLPQDQNATAVMAGQPGEQPMAPAGPSAAFVEAGSDARTFAGKFRAIERLDRGGTVETYRVVDETGAVFAVDVLHPQSEPQVQHLKDSMYAVAALHHPDLPRVFEWGLDGTGFYVVREYVEGWDLETLLTRGPLDPLRVARYGAEAALGLAAAHSAGIVHGSVRTSDVMVTPQGAVKVLGLGETLPRTLTPADPPAGAYYLAPEQVRGEAPNDCTDLYALGVVLYEAATGAVPFEGPDAGTVAVQQVEHDAEPARRVNPGVPASLDIVIMHALHKQPRDRYRTMDEFRQDLDRVGDQIQSGAAPSEALAEAPRRRMPRWVWITALAVIGVLVLGGVLGGWLWWRNNMTQVPSVVATTPDDARSTLAKAGLDVGNITYSDQVQNGVAEGQVLSQDPAANTWARRGGSVSLVINGPQKVTVPSVIGKTQTEALDALQGTGLIIGNITSSFNATVPVGQIVSQDPTGGAEASKGSPVALVVSKGPQVSTVPGVVGQEQSAATSTLEKGGFKVTTTQQYSTSVASGIVISQSPDAGTDGKVGDTVALVISQGPQPVTVPDVKGKLGTDAIDLLQAQGLKVKMVYTTGSGALSPDIGKVIDQSPAGGSSAKAGDTVTINVALP